MADDGDVGRLALQLDIRDENTCLRAPEQGYVFRHQIAHGVIGGLAVVLLARVIDEQVGEARHGDVFIDVVLRLQNAALVLAGEIAGAGLEMGFYERGGLLGAAKPLLVGSYGIKRQKGTCHGKGIVKVRAAFVRLAMTEAAAGQAPVLDDPIGRLECRIQVRLVTGGTVEQGQRVNHPAVFTGIDVLVDGGHAKLAALLVGEGKVFAAVLSLDEVRVLARIERAIGAGEKIADVTLDIQRRLQIRRVMIAGVGLGIDAQIAGLDFHDLLEVRMRPVAVGGVLVGASPDRVDDPGGVVKIDTGDLERLLVALRAAQHGVFDQIAVEELLRLHQPADFLVAGLGEAFLQHHAQLVFQQRLVGEFGDRLAVGVQDRAGIIDDGLQHGDHAFRRQITPALDDFLPGPVEYNGRRPAVVLVAAGKIGVAVLINLDGDITLAHQFCHIGIGVGLFVHHMTPVAPNRLHVENNELVFPLRSLEHAVRPGFPTDEIAGGSHAQGGRKTEYQQYQ